MNSGADWWQGANISFWLITAVVVLPAFLAAFTQNIVRAAYSLFFTLFGMAGYYVLLGSDFLAITQVVIYVGGILVLLMFGVLLTNRPLERLQENRYLGAGLVAFLLLVLLLGGIVWFTAWPAAGRLAEPAASVRQIGFLLLNQYLLVLEAAGMTLLLCLIGAAYLVRRKER